MARQLSGGLCGLGSAAGGGYRVLEPVAARAAAVLTTVVVFPTPPFWFNTAMVLIVRCSSADNPMIRYLIYGLHFLQDGIEHAVNEGRRFIGTELFGKLDSLVYYNFWRDIRTEFQLINCQS